MSLDKLLHNPEKYRASPNFVATNLVYPVLFEGQRYIVKQVRPLWSFLANAYYTVQDQFLFGTRQLASPWLRLEIEVKKLRRLNGLGTPKLIYFDGETLIREYLSGISFRDLSSDQQRQQTLEGALTSLEQIHAQDVVIGDAHVKNVIASQERACWLDLEGLFDESDLEKSKAIDLLKFVYSTYSVTRDHWAALAAAELVVKQYGDVEVKQRIPALATRINGNRNGNRGGNLGLWFSTRLPRDGRLRLAIGRVLRG